MAVCSVTVNMMATVGVKSLLQEIDTADIIRKTHFGYYRKL